MGMILVTGGMGYIGSHTVVELSKAGYDVLILDNLSNSSLFILERLHEICEKKISFVKGDIRDFDFLSTVFSENKIEGVIHFAALKSVGESVQKPLEYFDNNLTGTINVLRAMEVHSCENMIFSSSCTVYGQPPEGKIPVSEETPLQKPTSPYGTTKLLAESILEDTSLNSKIKSIALRYFNPVGAHRTAKIGELPTGVPSNLMPFITQTAFGIHKNLNIFGNKYNTPDGSCIRDYIHVVDLAVSHVISLQRILKNKNESPFEVFNVGTGKGVSVLELVQKFMDVTGVDVPYKIVPRREGDTEKIWAAPEKIQNVMGWKATHSLEDMIVSSWNWENSYRKRENK